ncbi:MAG TPA: DUF523 and DUF1722 domain-containing protein [Longimicrobiales bacterium]
MSDVAWPRPRLVASACLELEACRYNGQRVRAPFLPRLRPWVELVPVCPEVELGLGVPRPAIRLVQLCGATRLVQPSSGRDLTEEMDAFAEEYLAGLGPVDGFLLKSRSPSCGPKDVKVYGESGQPVGEKSAGRFAAAVRARYPLAALEDEGRLTNQRLRHHFLTRLFQGARLRALPESMDALVGFHTAVKLLLLAHSEPGLRALGRVVANESRLPATLVKERYATGFAEALTRPPRTGAVINALLHAFGHFSEVLTPSEKGLFLSLLDAYRRNRSPVEAPLALIRAWAARHGSEWVERQSFFLPYPAELQDVADSAAGAAA